MSKLSFAKPFFLLLVSLILLSLPAQAQTVRSITLDDAIRIGLEQDIQLKQSMNELGFQGVNVRRQKANFLPSFSLGLTPGVNYGLAFNQTTGRLENERTEQFSFGGNASVNLFNGFGDVSALKQAELNRDASVLDTDRSKQTVIATVISQFLQVLLDREQIRIQEENLESQNQLLARIEEFTRVGTRPVSDLYQQQSLVAQAEATLLNAEQAYQLNQSRLIQTLQLDPFQAYDFTAPATEDVVLTPQAYDLNALIQEAFQKRADLQARRVRTDAAYEGIRGARSSLLPSINLSGGYGSAYTSSNTFAGFGDQLDQNRGGNIRLNFSIPIFDRLLTKTQVERAKVDFANARLTQQNLEQSVAVEVRQAYLDYQSDIKRLDVTEKQVRAAEQALEAEQERYNVGASTLVELSQARATYVQGVSDRATAIYRFLLRGRLIENAVGTLDPSQRMFE